MHFYYPEIKQRIFVTKKKKGRKRDGKYLGSDTKGFDSALAVVPPFSSGIGNEVEKLTPLVKRIPLVSEFSPDFI